MCALETTWLLGLVLRHSHSSKWIHAISLGCCCSSSHHSWLLRSLWLTCHFIEQVTQAVCWLLRLLGCYFHPAWWDADLLLSHATTRLLLLHHHVLHHTHHILHHLHLLHVLLPTTSIHVHLLHLLLEHHHLLLHHLHLLWVLRLTHLLWCLLLWSRTLLLHFRHCSTGQGVLPLSVPHIVLEWVIQIARHIVTHHGLEARA